MIVSEQEQLPKPVLIKNLGMMYPTENSKKEARYGLYRCGFCGNEFKANTNNINRGQSVI
jgi:DNA-directed RNA polymerase subunit M/transcription elongation factor TFIIS